jgi:hypothetical protein
MGLNKIESAKSVIIKLGYLVKFLIFEVQGKFAATPIVDQIGKLFQI